MLPTFFGDSHQPALSNVFAYRRQFVLGPRKNPIMAGWCTWNIGKGLILQTHPDLPCVQKCVLNKKVTALGYIIDSGRRELNTEAIVSSIIQQVKQLYDLFVLTNSLSGRWILIFESEKTLYCFRMPAAYVLWSTRPLISGVD
jgi:hypothetical protein